MSSQRLEIMSMKNNKAINLSERQNKWNTCTQIDANLHWNISQGLKIHLIGFQEAHSTHFCSVCLCCRVCLLTLKRHFTGSGDDAWRALCFYFSQEPEQLHKARLNLNLGRAVTCHGDETLIKCWLWKRTPKQVDEQLLLRRSTL